MPIEVAGITQYKTEPRRRSFVPFSETLHPDELELPHFHLIATAEVRHRVLVGDEFYDGAVVLEVIPGNGNTISVDQ
ncbi:MAG TPA: hypothetical protein VK752_08885 [Bryobacteraceae bacterium]|jgi:hypothetical protein|nr:hypothetical protein [Bryobacteraceae bacterium]